MNHLVLTGTGLLVSKLCLGTYMFGGQTDEKEAHAILDYAFAQDINFFDTANTYNQGESEWIVGKWLKNRREQIVLATKVGNPMGKNPLDTGLTRRNIQMACEKSLSRLGVDCIDLYYLHKPDYNTPLEETMQAMDQLVREGKIRYIGMSNFASWQIADAIAICEKHGWVPPVVTQNVYNLLTRDVETELIPFINHHNIGLTVYNPIAGGLLTGKHQPGVPAPNTRFAFNKRYYDRYWTELNFAMVEKFSAIAKANDMTVLELSLLWCAYRPGVTSVIAGVSKLAQVEQNIRYLEKPALSPDIVEQCSNLWLELTGNRFSYVR